MDCDICKMPSCEEGPLKVGNVQLDAVHLWIFDSFHFHDVFEDDSACWDYADQLAIICFSRGCSSAKQSERHDPLEYVPS